MDPVSVFALSGSLSFDGMTAPAVTLGPEGPVTELQFELDEDDTAVMFPQTGYYQVSFDAVVVHNSAFSPEEPTSVYVKFGAYPYVSSSRAYGAPMLGEANGRLHKGQTVVKVSDQGADKLKLLWIPAFMTPKNAEISGSMIVRYLGPLSE